MHIGIGIRLSGQKAAGGGAPAPTVLSYALLDGFEETTGRLGGGANSWTLVGPVVQGAGAVRYNQNGNTSLFAIKTALDDTAAPSTWGADPIMAVMLDFGDDPVAHAITNARPTITINSVAYAYQVDTGAGASQPQFGGDHVRGREWYSFPASRLRQTNFAGATMLAAPSGAKRVQFDLSQNSASNANNSLVTLDAMVRLTEAYKPCVALTWDDVNERQWTELQPMLVARNLKSTGYMAMDLLDTGAKITTAQAQLMKDSGLWAWCLDSSPIDAPLYAFDTPAAAITQLNAHAADLIASGLGNANDAKHVCYSYGQVSYRSTPVTMTCTANGTTTLTVSSPLAWSNFIMPGMVVKGTGLGSNPTVVSVPTATSIVLSAAVSTGSLSLTFCAVSRGVNVVCNNTTTITGINTTGVVVGQVMTGHTVPANTTVASIVTEGVSGSITVSNAVPSTCVEGNFALVDGPWYYNKMEDALIEAGYLTGRRGVSTGGHFTGFGMTPQLAMRLKCASLDTNPTLFAAQLEEAIVGGRDLIAIGHFFSVTNAADVEAMLDAVETARDAGRIDVVTMPEFYTRATGRTFA